ncbi:MAG: SLBB domain-containing protein [Armatimonadota bacterium]|nr:SLBB domain-containing protein [Armatimonadota bacterium]
MRTTFAMSWSCWPLMAAAACLMRALPAGGEEPYRLGVDDVIAVSVLYHPDFSLEAATVRPDGMINVPGAGDLRAEGRTVVELADAVAGALRDELRDPKVSVRLVRRHVLPVYVLGAVGRPGPVEVREPVTVAEAVALAGGLSAQAAPRWATLMAADGRQRRIDVLAALSGGGEQGAVTIAPGETLLVSTQFLVSVVGEVNAPGRYPAEQGDRVADLLASAGGTTDRAAAEGTLVRPDGESIRLDVEAIAQRGEAASNVAVAPGDLIVIPEARRRVTVVGAVQAPGRYEFDDGERVSHAVAVAQGATEDARLPGAVLVRADGSSLPVNLEGLLQGEAGAADPELADGDVLIVPRSVDRVAVLGMVVKPGLVALEPEMTLMDALGAAGGWAEEGAEPERTILWREGGEGPQMRFIDARALMLGRGGPENPILQPGDIIFVPSDSGITRDEAARLLLGVAGLLRIVF